METLVLKTTDNIKIALNHYQKGFDEVVIIIHGWFMTKDSNAFTEIAEHFSKNFDCISFDCRGHGKSSGFYTFSSKETLDVETVVNFAKKHYKKIYLVGFSLGGGLAVIHAAQKNDVDKVIAVSAHADFNKIENKMWKKEAWRETFRKMELKRWFSVRPSIVISQKIAPIDIVDKIKIPTLFIAGANDPTVCMWHTKKLYEKAGSSKKFELFEDGIHAEDLYLHEPERFMNVCIDWLREK